MSDQIMFWRGSPIPFRRGESVSTALFAAGIVGFGPDLLGGDTRYFCGIGACQACLVKIDGRAVEACLTPARTGLVVTSLKDAGADDDRA